MKASHHEDESARLANLAAYRILDTPPEAAFDRIANLAQQTLEMPIAAISFVDRNREWFKAGVGFTLHDIPRQDSFCAYTILEPGLLVVPDATADPRFADNPFVTGGPRLRFYAGAPLRTPEGQAIGTLAVMDSRPHDFDQRQREILRDLASLLVDELSLRNQHQKLRELHLSIEARTAELIQSNRDLHAEIRHRLSADDQHQRSERHFRQLFEQASDAAFVHDCNGHLVDVNAAACASLGYSREELLNLSITNFETAYDDQAGDGLWRKLAVGSVGKFEGCHRRKDGSMFPVEIHVSVLDTSEGHHLLALVRDITARKQSEDLLRVRARNQEAIARLGSRALSGGDENALLQKAVVLVGETLGVERCRVHEHLAERNAFVVRASLDPADPGLGIISSDDKASSVPGYVLHTAQSVIVEDVDNDGRFEGFGTLRVYGAKSALCVLIGGPTPGDLRFGVLGVATRHRRAFTEEDKFFVQSVANVLAAAIVRQRGEDALRMVQARYLQIAANTSGMVFHLVMKPDRTVTMPFVSDGCRQLYELEPAEMQAEPQWLHRVVHPEDKEGYRPVVRRSVETLEPFQWEGRVLLRSGTIRWVTARAHLEQQPNGDVIWNGVVLDVSELKRAQQAMLAAKEEAERANEAKSRFLSRTSHELRTPLNAILGFGQVLEMGQLGEQDAQSVEHILKGGRHLLCLVDEILDLARVEAGEMVVDPSAILLDLLSRECLSLVARVAQARGITCTVETSPSWQVSVWADQQRLRQVLLNLLSNAIKYNREGGQVFLSAEQTGTGRVRLKVRDTGHGISSEGLQRLFAPFERLGQERGAVEGTGLGLAVSKQLVEAMGGSMGVESRLGQGSTFWVELAAAERPAAMELILKPSVPSPEEFATRTLLYIEDNQSNVQVIETIISRSRPQWIFLSAHNGRGGLQQASEHVPDLILLDMQLPDINGDMVLASLRDHPLTRQIPVMLLTADVMTHNGERMRSLGADDYLSKPFSVADLLQKLDALIQKRADHSVMSYVITPP